MQALWMILASLSFASMGVCIKFASVHFNGAEILFYRGIFGIVFMAAFARARGTSLRTAYPAMHAWRSVIGVTSMAAWFYAISHLPLATAMTLNYMSSIWIAAFLVGGALMLGKGAPKQGPLVLAILTSFAGVVLLLRPAIAQNQAFPAMVGLLSGFGAAFAYMQVMAMARLGEPDTRTVFYFAFGTMLTGLVGMAGLGLSAWSWPQALWLLPMGLFASLGQLSMTKAYSIAAHHGGTLMVANLQYSGVVFAALYGVLLFGDNIPLSGWVGMTLIILSAIAATVLRARAAPNAPAEEH
ncbi:MAG: DMT family transporter [Pseudomonadota bacterium]